MHVEIGKYLGRGAHGGLYLFVYLAPKILARKAQPHPFNVAFQRIYPREYGAVERVGIRRSGTTQSVKKHGAVFDCVTEWTDAV